MADAFPSNILDNVLEQLELSIFQSTKLNFLQRIQVRDLRSKLELIKCVIDDAEQIAVLFPDVVGKWVRDLQRVLYEIDDLLDEVVTRSLPSSGVLKKVHLRLRLYSLPLDLTLAPKLKNFNKRLDSIVKECYKCNLLVKPAHSTSIVGGGVEKSVAWEGILRSNPNDPNVDHCKMIGRDDDKKKIIQMLIDEDHHAAPFIWIRGKGGVGKTTLCRAIYNDEDVGKHFDRQMWADYKSLGDSIVRHEIVSLIERKEKTLIVLDNAIGDCKGHNLCKHFSDVRSLIATSDKGKKILITSSRRSPSSDISVFQDAFINELPGEHCWSIFENTVFVDGHDKKEWMEALGKDIANKCLGNPFLVRAVGTLLYQNNDEALWARDFDFKRPHERYIVISRLSQLFPNFQQPVGYLTLFTKDVPKQKDLISQFAAHGFTNFSTEVQQYFFAEPKIEEDHWDETPRFVIDRMHEHIITMLPGSEAVFLGGMETGCDEKARHVAIDRLSSSAAQQRDIILPRSLTNDVVHKRSLLFPKELSPIRMSVETLDMLTSKLLYLRVLDLHDLALKALPGSFGKLIHLRYVDLSRNDFKMLPESIGRLKNLQTLKLTYCDKLVKLPQCIKNLRQLKRLELNMCFDLIGMPSAIAEMTSLETLDRYVVGPHSSGLRYLKHVNNLRGSLSIELPRQWKQYTIEDAEQANLKSKEKLASVHFKWSGGAYSGDDENVNKAVFEELEPCTNLTCLYIINFGGKTFPSWITSLGMKNNLSHIVISHCRGCKILPPFHMMPKLRRLHLAYMDMEYLQDDNNGGLSADTVFFPSLSELKIGSMPKLIGWSRDMSSLLLRFSGIDNVEIWGCPRLTVMPPFSNIEHQLILQDISKKMLQVIDWKTNQYLEIVSITDMVSISEEFITKLPRALRVKDCHDWQMFWANEVEQTLTSKPLSEGFQRLVHLSIANCRAMRYLSSSLRHLINLEWLEIYKCSEELDCFYEEDEDGMPWKALQRLRFLKIRGFDKLVSLPRALQHLPCPLSQLGIMDCKSLKSCFLYSETGELFEVFGGLKGLSIVNCPEIKYVSSGLRHLDGLRHLEISKCSEELDCLCEVNEDGMPWKALRVLESLKIDGFENLVALPNGLQHLTSLLKLEIRDCKTLEGESPVLPRLRVLYMESCPRFSKEHGREHRYLTVVEEKMKSPLFQGFGFSCRVCNKFHPVGGADV